jgi:hypothetical protein
MTIGKSFRRPLLFAADMPRFQVTKTEAVSKCTSIVPHFCFCNTNFLPTLRPDLGDIPILVLSSPSIVNKKEDTIIPTLVVTPPNDDTNINIAGRAWPSTTSPTPNAASILVSENYWQGNLKEHPRAFA